jgi:hypothetical protein
MAQFTLDSRDITSRLVSLAKRLADAVGWVCQQPRRIKIEIPDDLWQHYGETSVAKFYRATPDCGTLPPPRIGSPCLVKGLPQARAEVEILIGVLKKKRSKRTRSPRNKRDK